MNTINKKPLIILTGPTAVGKTELSIQLAKKISGEIISADSMQIYKYMDIGTAKIKTQNMQNIPHYLVDELDPREEFHVVKFKEMALAAMEQIEQNGHIPILVGGTGFYIQAILYDIHFTKEEDDPVYRSYLEEIAKNKGEKYLHDMLRKVDKESGEQIHKNNIKRVIRALEYYKITGKPISKHNEEEKNRKSPYRFAYFVLNSNRRLLYERINQRVDKMLAEGLVTEVRKLASMGYQKEMVSMQGIGYKEIFPYLEGEISYEEAVEQIKRDTRHFAKRQLTWFRREKDVRWIEKEAYQSQEAILSEMLKQIKEAGIL